MKRSMSTIIRIAAIALLLSTVACRSHEIHQGNVLKDDKAWSIYVGDSRFQVESLLGTPAMTDPLHPNRVRYVEDMRNVENEPDKLRVIEITYDNALRVEKIERIGFNQGGAK
jgi:outer membrane protein assembly factor BamE (lipoprotein component of BamABCDE complex)